MVIPKTALVLVLIVVLSVCGDTKFDNDLDYRVGQNSTRIRQKRSVLNLCRMMKCTTGRSCLNYLGYGCWCGLQSSGTIMDGIDRCCYYHDQCAEASLQNGCHYYNKRYRFTCGNGNPRCQNTGSRCKMFNCQCDLEFALCIAQYPYNGKLGCSSRG